MATILVIGASRGIGLETVHKALEDGHVVRALARSADTIEIVNPNLQKIVASALDENALRQAMADVDAVIITLGSQLTFKPVSLFSRSTRAVVDIMTELKLKRLIAVTGLGAGDSRDSGGLLYSKLVRPFLLGPIYDDKDVEEQIIKKSGLDWTIVRPGILTRLPKKGRYQILTEPRTWTFGFISRGDVADFLVRCVTDQSYIGKTPLLIDE